MYEAQQVLGDVRRVEYTHHITVNAARYKKQCWRVWMLLVDSSDLIH